MYVYRIIIIIINIIRHLMREVVEEAEAEWGKSTQEMSKKKKIGQIISVVRHPIA